MSAPGGVAGDAADEIFHRLFELRFRHEAIHQTEFQGGSAVTGSPVSQARARFGSDEKRQKLVDASGGKMPILISGCANRALGVAIIQIHRNGQLRAAADCRPVHDADDGLADFQHTPEGRGKSVEHLKHPLRSVFAESIPPQTLASGIQDDQLDVVALASMSDSPAIFGQHGFIEKECGPGRLRVYPGDAAVDAELHMLNWSGLRRSGCEVKSWVLQVQSFQHSWAFLAHLT